MALDGKTSKLGLPKITDSNIDKPDWGDFSTAMEVIDEKVFSKEEYDPTNVGGDAFRASNQKMTGYAKSSEYTAITPSDNASSAIGKLEAGVAATGDMKKATYDTDGDGKVDQAEVADKANSVDWASVQGRPNTLPNPNALTLQLNGETKATYTGSAATTVNVTVSAIGAASLIGGKVPSNQLDIVDETDSTEKTKIASANSVRMAKSEAVAAMSKDILEIRNVLLWSGAGAHNFIYRGKFLGNAVTTVQYTAISSGTFDDLYIGDYWTISGVNYRIAAFDYFYRCGDIDLTTHHVVIVPDTALYHATMNATAITTGAYVGSLMYTTNLAQAKTTINAAFSGHVMQHRQYLTNAVANGKAIGGAWFDCTVELMNELMVYGSGMLTPVPDDTTIPANHAVSKSQLPLFALRHDLIANRTSYWLRDVVSGAVFTRVGGQGNSNYDTASASHGVRPAFSIK